MPPRRAEQPLPNMPELERTPTIVVPSLDSIRVQPEPEDVSMPFPDMPVVEEAVVMRFDPKKQRAFASIPGFVRKTVDETLEVTPSIIDRIQPENIRAALFSTQPGGQKGKMVDGVALNPSEHAAILINYNVFLQRVSNPAERKYMLANETIRTEHVLRRKITALGAKRDKHVEVLNGLRDQWQTVHQLQEYSQYPGLRRKNETDMRTLSAAVMEGPITNMIGVVAQQNRWSDADKAVAMEALNRALSYGPSSMRIANWRQILQLTAEYLEVKGALFADRERGIRHRRIFFQKQLDKLYESTGFFVLPEK